VGMNYPAYVSINEAEGPAVCVSVRSLDAMSAGNMVITIEQAEELATKLLAHVDSIKNPARLVDIMINMEPFKIMSNDVLTYEDVCRYAKQDPARNPSTVYSIRNGASGFIDKGKAGIRVVDGMHINCIVTGNA